MAPPRVGEVVEINVSSERDVLPRAVGRVRATKGGGLEGEYHYFTGPGIQPERDHELTLIATEALDALSAEHGIEAHGCRVTTQHRHQGNRRE